MAVNSEAVTPLPPPRGSSIEPPRWLWASATVLLAVRLFLSFVWHPPQPPSGIHWYSKEEAPVVSQKLQKPVLYVITADWSPPCISMEQNAFANNRQVINIVNESFVPVRIADRESKNDTATADLLKLYNISYLPSFVATRSDGTIIRETNSYNGAHALQAMLLNILVDADYAEAKALMKNGEFAEADASFRSYLEHTRWATPRSQWAAIFDVLSLRAIGKHSEADAMLKAASAHQRAFQYSCNAIVDYLSGRTDEQALLNRTYRQEDSVSYHFAIGMNAYAQHDMDKAQKHLQWVSDNADKHASELLIARAILKRRIQTGK